MVIKKQGKLTRAEKAVENRARLVAAAQQVIGEYGYADASIARIAERAGLAQGTFYLYFESRQDLFDQLLPEVGGKALSFIRSAVDDAKDFAEMEERGLDAFFHYAVKNPGYFRVLSEAEIAAPDAYRAYTDKRTGSFLAAVTAAWERGEITGYTRRELGVLTQVMLASRAYLFQEYAKSEDGLKVPPAWVVRTYVKFLKNGLGGSPQASPDPVKPSRERREDPLI